MECEEYCLYQFVKHFESNAIQPPIGVHSLIYGIFSIKKKHIVTCDDEIGGTSSVLTLSYKLIVRKHVSEILMYIIVSVDETDMFFMKKHCMGL